MRVLLTNDEDAAAPWMASQLKERIEDLVWLPASSLAAATSWSHHVEPDGRAWTRVRWAHGREIDSREVTGVVNRLRLPPQGKTERVTGADKDYVMQEWWAFTVAWLASLECPVLNPAMMTGLSGAPIHPLDVFVEAADCGLMCARGEMSSDRPGGAAAHWDPVTWTGDGSGADLRGLLVVGETAVSDGRWSPSREMCLGAITLAERLRMPLLGVWFTRAEDVGSEGGEKSHVVVGATAHPDLRLFGEPGMDAIHAHLAGSCSNECGGKA